MYLRRAFDADQEMIVAHLVSLSEPDRMFRFGGTAKERSIRSYVANIPYLHDGVFIYTDDNIVVGCIHVSLGDDDCEISVSVSSEHRGNGYATKLMETGLLFARNRYKSVAKSHYMPSNNAMRKVAERMMEKTQSGEGELVASVAIPNPTALSYAEEFSFVASSLNESARQAVLSFLPQFHRETRNLHSSNQ